MKATINTVLKRADFVSALASGLTPCIALVAQPAGAVTAFTGRSAPAGSSCTAISVYGAGLAAAVSVKFGPLSGRRWVPVSRNGIRVHPLRPEDRHDRCGQAPDRPRATPAGPGIWHHRRPGALPLMASRASTMACRASPSSTTMA